MASPSEVQGAVRSGCETGAVRDSALVVAAHGTRDPAGPAVLERLMDDVRDQLPGVDVRLSYVDVIEPTLHDVLADVQADGRSGVERPVVVPLFLASGYHVRVDVPDAVSATGDRAVVTPALGADPAIVEAVADRLRAAGPLPDAVVMAAAGSSDERALAEVESASVQLASLLGRDVATGYVTTAQPAVPDAVAALRSAGHDRVGIAPYLLAPGLFLRRLAEAGADVVSEPIGVHPRVVDLITHRFLSHDHEH